MDNIKLDFGSGYNPEPNFKTCDIYGYCVDYYFDKDNYKILDCEENMFDEIYCRNVIHHIKDLDKLLKEFKRVLKKGGVLKIIEPRKEFYYQNYILDTLWYRFVIPRKEVWFSENYRDYITLTSKKLIYIKTMYENEKEISSFYK